MAFFFKYKIQWIPVMVLLSMLDSIELNAQDIYPQILNAAGNTALINGYIVDYNVGEMTAVETLNYSEGMLTQGFLQSALIPEKTSGDGTGIKVWPGTSPNDDSQGYEHLQIDNIENYPENDIQIFNRWGNLVFQMSAYDNDEHSFKGFGNTGMFIGNKELPDGTYFYILKAFDPTYAATHRYTGFFVLKRK